ncbi:MAG: bifunctional 4-hydroxy-2-oxoglutarate aldolase/2-dehydro-3-deoxy-phosphogluconate aldolase [Clostridia bacterium]|nr:bifunctional 4-hydroxy-2-oxoglutarate aldolase/2-dehydro-3-deoxy-phosphogluconate aldolase [Clostridia bacterium]
MDLREVISENPILAIMRNVPKEITLDYAKAIIEGGINFFEVALNSPDALEQISMLKRAYGDRAYIGAGTAITVERAKAATDAGAQFLLSPSTDIEVLEYCRDKKIPILPGALTPSEVTTCLSYGFDVIKLFPAGDMPLGYIKSLKGPLDNTDYVAIGGVNKDNIAEFFRRGYIGVGLGSSILPKEAVAKRDWKAASDYVRELRRKAAKARG